MSDMFTTWMGSNIRNYCMSARLLAGVKRKKIYLRKCRNASSQGCSENDENVQIKAPNRLTMKQLRHEGP